jgi:hypothetical protein
VIPKLLHSAAKILSTLAASGCQIRIEENALVICDPQKTVTDKLRQQIQENRLAILALLMREALLHLVRVLDMAAPTIKVGMQEEYAATLLTAMRLVGEPWSEEDDRIAPP